MKMIQNISIKNKLIGIILLVTMLVIGIGFAIFIFSEIKRSKNELKNSTIVNASLIGEYSLTPLFFDDSIGVAKIIGKLKTIPYIESGGIYNKSGELFTSYTPIVDESVPLIYNKRYGSYFKGKKLHVYQPIVSDNEVYGTIYLRASTHLLWQKINRNIITMIVLMIGLMILSYFFAIRLQSIISLPILNLAEVTQKISNNADYSLRLQKQGYDEIGILYGSFNKMLEQIEIRQIERNKAEYALRESEKRFRKSFENSPVAILEEDFTEVKEEVDKIIETHYDIEAYLEGNPKKIKHLAKLAKIKDVNKASCILFNANDKEELLVNFPKTFTALSFEAFKKGLIAMVNGRHHMTLDAEVLTIDRITRHVTINWAIVPGSEKDFSRVLVSLIDITERKINESLTKLRWNLRQLADSYNVDELIAKALGEIEEIMQSKYSFYYVMSFDEKGASSKYYSQKTETEFIYQTKNGNNIKNEESEIWRECLMTRKPIFKNKIIHEHKTNQNRNILYKQLAVPIVSNNKIVAILVVCDESKNYTSEDIITLNQCADVLSEIIKRKRAEEEVLKREKKIEEQMKEYQALSNKYIIKNEELTQSLYNVQKINDELQKARVKAEESDKLKSSFLANMSHEIRTPMNGILGFVDLLKEPHLSGDQQVVYLDVIQRSGLRMLNIINDLIDISKIEAGQVEINYKWVNVNTIMDDLYNFYKPPAENKGIKISYEKKLSNNESQLYTDNTKLNQVLSNLVNNAIKYTNKGFVHFGYSVEKNKIKFFVEDSGVGIPSGLEDKVFERFRQANLKPEKANEGAGLGLAISKAYVEMLKGKIGVISQLNKGSVFYFILPFEHKNKPVFEESLPIVDERLDFTGSTILVAEDDEVSYSYIEQVLSKTNAKLLHAWDGKKAIELCYSHPEISMILMDVKMQGMDGLEASKQIKEFRPELPIIVQTAYTFNINKQKVINMGCDDYLSKPLNKKELILCVEKYMK